MPQQRWAPVQAVLFDRDGTLIEDVPYNGDPRRVRPVPGAPAALRTLRGHGIYTGVVTNQAGIAHGFLDPADVAAVNARVSDLLGPFDVWRICPHDAAAGCRCRKPAPGMILDALAELGVPASRAAMIGDIGADVGAGRAAGVRSILVPTRYTQPAEVRQAQSTVDGAVDVAPDLSTAVRLLTADRVPAD